jgi:hypothetical protein
MRDAAAENLDDSTPEYISGVACRPTHQGSDIEKVAHRYITRILNQGISINIAIREEELFENEKRSRICCDVSHGESCAKWNFPIDDLDRAGVSLHAMIDTIIEHLLRDQIFREASVSG